jgi:hypothetical protein
MKTPQERRKIPVLLGDEDDDDAVGQVAGNKGPGDAEDDASGQIDILKKRDPGDQLDDTEG